MSPDGSTQQDDTQPLLGDGPTARVARRPDRPQDRGCRVPGDKNGGMVRAPIATSAAVSRRFSGHPRRDTAPELALRRQLHRIGLRYRVDQRPVPELRRTADVVFTRLRIAVFVDGCFWHACPEHCSYPRVNAAWWREKLAGNRKRDHETTASLEQLGWEVLRFWSHEAPGDCAARVEELVIRRRVKLGLGTSGRGPRTRPE
jgi:DNA mismatch endonuclease (patch repair protein)